VQRRGRVTAILELGAGFHPDFTGRENLIFGAGLIGLGTADIACMSEEIIAFAELENAIDRPIKTYSSGMVVRLAFALVTAVQPDLLIIDEALAVGDQHFQKKSAQRIETFRRNGCTILFCSHSLYHVRQLCDQVLWLDQGQVRGLGDTESVISAYQEHVRLHDKRQVVASVPDSVPPKETKLLSDQLPVWAVNSGRHAGLIDAHALNLVPQTDDSDVIVLAGPDLIVHVQALVLGDEHPSFGVMLEQFQGVGITSIATHAEQFVPHAVDGRDGWTTWRVTLSFPNLPLHSGVYSLSFYLFDAQGLVVYDEWKDHITFRWISPSLTPGLVRLPHRWS
jgi:lipopolysaccharide transport system ATP-binding protein